MTSEEAVRAIADRRGDALLVCTMTTMKWLHQLSPGPLNVSAVPLMGGASGLGLGLALGRPDRKVVVLDGDGSLLMQLGTLVTVAGAAPGNFYHFVFENGVWFEGWGNLPIPGGDRVDFAGLAGAAGYATTYSFEDLEEPELERRRPTGEGGCPDLSPTGRSWRTAGGSRGSTTAWNRCCWT